MKNALRITAAVLITVGLIIGVLLTFLYLLSAPFSMAVLAVSLFILYFAYSIFAWVNWRVLEKPWFTSIDTTSWEKRIKEHGREWQAKTKEWEATAKMDADKANLKAAEAKASAQRKKEHQQNFVDRLQKRSWREPALMRVLGKGLPGFPEGTAILVSCISGHLHLSNVATTYDLPIIFSDISKIEVTGAGTITTGGGAMGGGFGMEGAIQGILIASLLNALTTRTTVDTFLTLRFDGTEITMQATKLNPLDLRLSLSPAILEFEERKKKDQPTSSMSEEIERLSKQFQAGVLTAEEFNRAKTAVISRWT